ncbi:glycerate kinase [Patescibacteria group bacterium]
MKFETIKNIDDIATNKLREDAMEILEAGYQSILTDKVVKSKVVLKDSNLSINGHEYDLDLYERIFFVGIGKCALDAAQSVEDILGDRITEGVVIDVRSGAPLKHLKVYQGSHPLPSEKNVEAAKNIVEMLSDTTEKDLVLVVISGGGSALLCLPNELRCEELAKITDALMKKGAAINEINTVRKHTSKIQGGQLAEIAYPATVASLIFSDVPGDYLSVIASGPTVLDSTTKEDAQKIVSKYNLWEDTGVGDHELLETPKEGKYFEKVENILLVTNKVALDAMKEKANEIGYNAEIMDSQFEGEAADLGKQLATDGYGKNSCVLYAGETTITFAKGKPYGAGGRNQEVALAALNHMKEDEVVVAAASDGWDNSDMAGAVADKELYEKSKRLGVDIDAALETHSTYDFYKRLGGYIDTGKTGVNVSDFYFKLTK